MKYGDESPASCEESHTPSKISKDDPRESTQSTTQEVFSYSAEVKEEAFEEEKCSASVGHHISYLDVEISYFLNDFRSMRYVRGLIPKRKC